MVLFSETSIDARNDRSRKRERKETRVTLSAALESPKLRPGILLAHIRGVREVE